MPQQPFSEVVGRESAWVRCLLALGICVPVVIFDLYLDLIRADSLFSLVPSLLAVAAVSARAGFAAGLISAGLLSAWWAFDLHRQAYTLQQTEIRCLLLVVLGAILGGATARISRLIRIARLNAAWNRQLLQTVADGIWVHERGVITFANARMAEMLGVSPGGLIHRNIEDFFFPADLSVERIRAANLRPGALEQFDRRLRREDGSEMWVLASCNVIVSATGRRRSLGSLAMMIDITERKRAEHALRRSEERFRNLFETVLEGVYQSTPEGRILAANPTLLRMLGVAHQEELNDIDIALDLYVDPDLRKSLLEQLERYGGFQNIEYDLRRRDGAIITVLENARVVRDENGAVLYYEGTLSDITQKKRMEEKLRQAQRTESLGRLAANVAHDFNNVLTLISGYTRLSLSELSPTHPAAEHALQALHASERAVELTRQLMSLRLAQLPAAGSVDLSLSVQRLSDRGGLDLRLVLPDDPTPVYASEHEIGQILASLLEHLRIGFPGMNTDVTIGVATLEREFRSRHRFIQPGSYAVLSLTQSDGAVAPAGVFTAPRLLEDPLFAPLQPAESAAMGLSATHATVAHYGGFIACPPVDREGNATGFHVFLPCALVPMDEAAESPVETSGETILLVGNEPLVRELSRDMLERHGYRVIPANDAREAERIGMSGGGFDLLIADLSMPDITGPELASRLRATHPGMKVLLISNQTGDREGQHQAEDAAVLQTPFSAASLERRIRQLFGRA